MRQNYAGFKMFRMWKNPVENPSKIADCAPESFLNIFVLRIVILI